LFYNSQMSMLEQYPGTNGREVMQTWVLFGDPSTQFRNKQTLNMVVSHASQVPLNTTSLVVNCDTEGALVAITQDNVLIGKGIVAGGTVTINFPALVSNLPLAVTATKQNYRPYQGPVQVGNGGLGLEELTASIALYPNPANGTVTIDATDFSVSQVELVSITGQTIGAFKSTGLLTIDLSGVAAGSYLVRIATEKGMVIKHLEVIR